MLAHGEQMFLALDGFGLDATTRLDLQVMLFSHVQGLAAQLERETQAQATTGMSDDQWMARHGTALGALASSGHYPGFSALLTEFGEQGYDLELDKIFELGLRTILDGMAILLSEHASEPLTTPPDRSDAPAPAPRSRGR
jgi:hypothetical protein